MRLILVRHAESLHARQGIIGGRNGCTGLTEAGFEQARRLAERLRADGASGGEFAHCDALLCSPVLRARQTAEALAEALPGLALVGDEGLEEMDPGEADGLTWREQAQRYGRFDPVNHPERPMAPGGESWLDFLARVDVTLERLAARYDGQTVLAVTHAGFVAASILALFDVPRLGRGTYLEPAYTSLTEWRHGDSRRQGGGRWTFERYNDTTHLGGG
jgi:probable phosphoglycerate mutase